jgi:hypothetical protein
VPLWQVVQPEEMPVWLIFVRVALYPAEWQSVQVCEVGMWLAGMLPPLAPEKLVKFLWQSEQFSFDGVVAGWLA